MSGRELDARGLYDPHRYATGWRETPPVAENILTFIMGEVREELRAAERKHPGWPDDPMQAVAIIAEELGEASKEAIEMVFRDGSVFRFEHELRQVAAVALRALAWCDEVKCRSFSERERRIAERLCRHWPKEQRVAGPE